RVPFNTGIWTDEEHQGFLHGLEVYGHGNWDAIGIFVPSRSPLQIEAYARWIVAQGEAARHLHQGIGDNLAAPPYPSHGGGEPGSVPSTGCGECGSGGGGGGGGGDGAAVHYRGVSGELAAAHGAAQEQQESQPVSQPRSAHWVRIPAVLDPHQNPLFYGEQAWGGHFDFHDACFGIL
ncbi:unnamed protein product, partial [Ectocarpus fasciculatus]